MTDIVNPSTKRLADPLLTAAAVSLGGGSDGIIVDEEQSPTLYAEKVANDGEYTIDLTGLQQFDEDSSSDSLDVTIYGGEAVVGGSYLLRDESTTVSLEPNTDQQVVYLGWRHDTNDSVVVGLDESFNEYDQRIPLYEYETDDTGVIN